MADLDRIESFKPRIVQWFIDTRPLWPVPKSTSSRDEVQALKTVLTKFQAAKELSLLTTSEQASVLRYYHLRDAKTKLASHLLKHLAISRFCSVPWSQSTISRGPSGKPFYLSTSSSHRLDFNVSHQAGLVSLIAAVNFPVPIDVGTDVVCVSERREVDLAYIDKDGFFAWIDMHADVFADSEISAMKLAPVAVDLRLKGARMSGYGMDAISRCQWRKDVVKVKIVGRDGGDAEVAVRGEDVVDRKVRRFYAWWCAREAYVKMTGEAFAAPWLKELEIMNVRAPEPSVEAAGGLEAGEVCRDVKLRFKRKPVLGVKMEIAALGKQYMIGAALRVPAGFEKEGGEFELCSWKELDLEGDLLCQAEEG